METEPSSSGSVLRWPTAAEVLDQASQWAALQRQQSPDLLAVGVFGSYVRGEVGVGSDLDLVRRWPTHTLPLAADVLVYSLSEWRALPQWNPRLARALQEETRWLVASPDWLG